MKNNKIIIEIREKTCSCKTIEPYKNVPGVWALYGVEKNSDSHEWQCLQVGQTSNMGYEIRVDSDYINQEKLISLKKNYVNQFGEKMFAYTKGPTSQEQLYLHISNEYHRLVFISVCIENDLNERKKIEKYFAWMTHALYWRNGGVYRDQKHYSKEDYDKQKNDVIEDKELENRIAEIIICIKECLREIAERY